MSQAYPRHVGSRSAEVNAQPTSGEGHVPSWSRSSNEDLISPLHLTPHEDEFIQAGPPDGVVEPPHYNAQASWWRFVPRRVRPLSFRRAVILGLTVALLSAGWFCSTKNSGVSDSQTPALIDAYFPPMPPPPSGHTTLGEASHPVDWLRENTILDMEDLSVQQVQTLIDTRPKAAFISLVRNEEVDDMVASIVQIEARFNKRETHQYDWVFFNNEEFTEEFKEVVSKATYSQCYFERINEEHWEVPDFIDETRFDVGRQFMGSIGVGKAWLQSYHHMCRWNAGLFAMEERLVDYDWFWRVEPGVQFYCDIKYDVFRFMQENNMSYGFNMAILDDARSFPSLWERTKEFIDDNGSFIHRDADFNWLLHDPKDHDETLRPGTGVSYASSDGEYNNCQFYSNFEIGSLQFFRGEEHQAYFDHLDRAGGFYYERYGDAPVHTLSVNMFLPRTQIWYFRDIGYAHGLCEQCPPHEHQLLLGSEPNGQVPREVEQQANESDPETMVIESLVIGPFESFGSKRRQWDEVSRDVKRQAGIPGLSCGCTTSAIDNNNAKLVPFESKQRKPSDPCILTQGILQAVMMLSIFWMVEKLIPSSGGTSYDAFIRAVLFASVGLYVFWGLPWTVNTLIPRPMDSSHKLHRVTQLFIEQANW